MSYSPCGVVTVPLLHRRLGGLLQIAILIDGCYKQSFCQKGTHTISMHHYMTEAISVYYEISGVVDVVVCFIASSDPTRRGVYGFDRTIIL